MMTCKEARVMMLLPAFGNGLAEGQSWRWDSGGHSCIIVGAQYLRSLPHIIVRSVSPSQQTNRKKGSGGDLQPNLNLFLQLRKRFRRVCVAITFTRSSPANHHQSVWDRRLTKQGCRTLICQKRKYLATSGLSQIASHEPRVACRTMKA